MSCPSRLAASRRRVVASRRVAASGSGSAGALASGGVSPACPAICQCWWACCERPGAPWRSCGWCPFVTPDTTPGSVPTGSGSDAGCSAGNEGALGSRPAPVPSHAAAGLDCGARRPLQPAGRTASHRSVSSVSLRRVCDPPVASPCRRRLPRRAPPATTRPKPIFIGD